MADGWFALLFVVGFTAVVPGIAIWADSRDRRAHDAWYEHPDRIWNQWRKDDEEEA